MLLAEQLARFFLFQKATVLEFGAGHGCYVDRLLNAGVDVVGAFDGASDVASYLAANDGLYRRQILTPFSTQPEYVPELPLPDHPRREICLPSRVTIHEDNAAPMRLAPSIFMDYMCILMD